MRSCLHALPRPAARTLFGAATVFAVLLFPGTSQGAVTIGSDLERPAASPVPAPELLTSTLSSPTLPDRQTLSPIDGVIHAWRIKSFDLEQPGTLRLRVIRGFLGVRSGPYVNAAGGKLESFTIGPQGLPISAGEGIGVDNGNGDDPGVWLFAGSVTGATVNYWDPYLADGEFRAPTESANDFEVLVAADVQPDSDGDRFGDETHDSCPGQSGELGGCPGPSSAALPPPPPAPQTRILKGLNRLLAGKRGATARFRFTSSEPGARFQCALRKKGKKRSTRERRLARMATCRSPKAFKRLRPGSYLFLVRAIGTTGPDPSPAKDSFRVVRG